jgi:predicted alpha/beta hydrolase
VQTLHQPEKKPLEQADYFEVPGAHLYTVLHLVADPVARVLLVGPFASERQNSYGPWVRWARYLAERRIEVLRYDYRGIGESTGNFGEMTVSDWYEDVLLLAGWLSGRSPALPLLLHGLEVGAILAGKAFQSGIGDALLLWSPPANANVALRATLLRWMGLLQLLRYSEERKTASDCIRELEQGTAIEVEGYQWSPKLWRDSFNFELPPAMGDDESALQMYDRPVKSTILTADAAPLAKKGIVGGGDEIRDLSWLYSANFEWISGILAGKMGVAR